MNNLSKSQSNQQIRKAPLGYLCYIYVNYVIIWYFTDNPLNVARKSIYEKKLHVLLQIVSLFTKEMNATRTIQLFQLQVIICLKTLRKYKVFFNVNSGEMEQVSAFYFVWSKYMTFTNISWGVNFFIPILYIGTTIQNVKNYDFQWWFTLSSE